MSLKAFHIFFIAVSDLMAVGLAAWAWMNQKPASWVAFSIVSSVALNIYLVWFLKKSVSFKNP